MFGRLIFSMCVLAPWLLSMNVARAQDVPGIEICTVEKTMERRTSCLQSNIEFLQKTIAKLSADHQQKLDAAKAQVEALKASIAALQKVVGDLQAAQGKPADAKKAETPPVKEAPKEMTKDTAKEGAAKDGAAKDSGK